VSRVRRLQQRRGAVEADCVRGPERGGGWGADSHVLARSLPSAANPRLFHLLLRGGGWRWARPRHDVKVQQQRHLPTPRNSE
jgi:hypothetical protein